MKRNILSLAIIAGLLFAFGCEPTGVTPAAKMLNHKDSLSYAYGVQLAEMLKRQNEELDANVVAAAVREALEDKAQLTIEQCMDVVQENMVRKSSEASSKATEEGKAFLEENSTKDGVQITASGLQYRHIVEGTGNTPIETSTVTVHYKLSSTDGTVIQDSHDTGQPATFALNGVIKAWTEGLQLMKEGGSIELVVPSELGYGARGSGQNIPPHSTLIFVIDLISIATE